MPKTTYKRVKRRTTKMWGIVSKNSLKNGLFGHILLFRNIKDAAKNIGINGIELTPVEFYLPPRQF